MAPPPVVHVERAAGGGVVVRVAYPPGKLLEAAIGTAVVCCALVAFPMLFLWFDRSFRARWSILLWPGFLPAAVVTALLALRASSMALSYTFEADGDGITIRRRRGRLEWRERLPRERITDVRIGFGGGGRSGQDTAWLVIAVKPWCRPNRTLLRDLGGDHVARVADALRAGVGLPPRSWP